MATLDATTQAEYAAEVNAVDRAQVIIDALADPVSVNVYNSDEIIVGSGVMTDPWATISANGITPSTLDGFFVTTGGVPDGGWTLRFESGGRYVILSFGLASSGAEAVWSLDSWDVGTRSGISGGEIVITGNRAPVWSGPSELVAAAGATEDFSGYVSDPDSDSVTFSLVSATNGYSITPTGVLTVGTVEQSVTIRATDPDGLYDDLVCSVTYPTPNPAEIEAGTEWDEFAENFEFASSSLYYDLAFGGSARRASNAPPMYPKVVSTPAYRGSRAIKFNMPEQTGPSASFYRSEIETDGVADMRTAYTTSFDHFIGLAVYLNPNFPSVFPTYASTAVVQYASTEAPYSTNNPRIGLRGLKSGNWGLTMEYFGGSQGPYDSGVSVVSDIGQWVRLQLHIRYHKAATFAAGTGFVRLYRNGTLILDSGSHTTVDTINMGYYKFGNYSALRQTLPTGTTDAERTLYIDSIRIASSRTGGSLAAVDPGNY